MKSLIVDRVDEELVCRLDESTIDADDGDFGIGLDGGERITLEAPEDAMESPGNAYNLKDRVEGLFRGGERWYPCTIKAVNGDGTYNLSYDDGDEEQRVPTENIRKMS
jgi:hypothetical protein